MAEHAQVIRVSHYRPAPGRRDDMIALLETGAVRAREIDGCFGIQICSSRENPDVVAAVSRWASQSALDTFLEMLRPGGELDLSSEGAVFAGPPTVEHLTPI